MRFDDFVEIKDVSKTMHGPLQNICAKKAPELSSRLTFYHKFLLPGAFFVGLPVWIVHAFRSGGYEWIPAVGWTVGCAFLVVWSLSIENVTAEDSSFLISNYRTKHRVPYTHLRSISERRQNKTRTIVLTFDPPTPLGRSIRIIPPLRKFEEAVSFLNSIISC